MPKQNPNRPKKSPPPTQSKSQKKDSKKCLKVKKERK